MTRTNVASRALIAAILILFAVGCPKEKEQAAAEQEVAPATLAPGEPEQGTPARGTGASGEAPDEPGGADSEAEAPKSESNAPGVNLEKVND